MGRVAGLTLVIALIGCTHGPDMSSVQSSTALVEAYIHAWNQGDLEAVDSLFASGAVHEDVAQGVRATSPEEIKAFITATRAVMPDLNLQITNIFTDGSRVAAEWTFTATLATGDVPASMDGLTIRTRGVSIAEIDEGRIMRFTDYYHEG